MFAQLLNDTFVVLFSEPIVCSENGNALRKANHSRAPATDSDGCVWQIKSLREMRSVRTIQCHFWFAYFSITFSIYFTRTLLWIISGYFAEFLFKEVFLNESMSRMNNLFCCSHKQHMHCIYGLEYGWKAMQTICHFWAPNKTSAQMSRALRPTLNTASVRSTSAEQECIATYTHSLDFI